jgi:transglutaminase superfamily protein
MNNLSISSYKSRIIILLIGLFFFLIASVNTFAVIVELQFADNSIVFEDCELNGNIIDSSQKIHFFHDESSLLSETFNLDLLINVKYKDKLFTIFGSSKTFEYIVSYQGIFTIINDQKYVEISDIVKLAYKKIKSFIQYVESGHNPISWFNQYFGEELQNEFSNAGRELYELLINADSPTEQHQAVLNYLIANEGNNNQYLLELFVCSMVMRNKHCHETIYLGRDSEQNNLNYLWELPSTFNKLKSYIIQDEVIFTEYEIIKKILIYVAGISLAHGNPFPGYTVFNQKGACGDSAYLMAAITSAFNIPTRILSVCDYMETGHAVCEVLLGKEWAFFDPSYASFFKKRKHILSFKEIRKKNTRDKDVEHICLVPEKANRALLSNNGIYYYPDIIEEAKSIIIQNTATYTLFFVNIPLHVKSEVCYDLSNQGALGLGRDPVGNRKQRIIITGCKANKAYSLLIKFVSYAFSDLTATFVADATNVGTTQLGRGQQFKFCPAKDSRLPKQWKLPFVSSSTTAEIQLSPNIASPSSISTIFMCTAFEVIEDK